MNVQMCMHTSAVVTVVSLSVEYRYCPIDVLTLVLPVGVEGSKGKILSQKFCYRVVSVDVSTNPLLLFSFGYITDLAA